MQNRIDACFAALRQNNQKGFIAYITAGDPGLGATRDIALALEKSGVDILELGLPFSDPLADGIVNQLAAQRALAAGATARSVLDCIRDLRRESRIPIVLYTYLNPLESFGFKRFLDEAASAGVDGLLILDLPPDEIETEYKMNGDIRQIRLIAPTTPPERIGRIAACAEGFIYYVSREGVTGEQATVSESIGPRIALIRQHTSLPIAAGFGISSPDQARQVKQHADAVVVGSAIVKRIAEHGKSKDMIKTVSAYVQSLVAAVKNP